MPPRSRLVRRAPLVERIKASLNVWDHLLWVSEELNTAEWDDVCQQWAQPAGLAINLIFIISRANSASTQTDDVFAEATHAWFGQKWLHWLVSLCTHTLAVLSLLNALYVFQRKRHYRLFEHSVDAPRPTPSAHRVRVDSSPPSSSSFRAMSDALMYPTALLFPQEAQSDARGVSDVWELAVWDPTSFNLSLFCYFSPGHVLLYWMRLPLQPLDPRPSVSLATTLGLALIFSAHLAILRRFFAQQAVDKALVNRHVQNEYDTKYVRPALNKPVRDVGVQTPSTDCSTNVEVLTYTPTIYVKRAFSTNPNPDYSGYLPQSSQIGPGSTAFAQTRPDQTSSPLSGHLNRALQSPAYKRQSEIASTAERSDGGSLGIYQHAQSPLRKALHSRGTGSQSNAQRGKQMASGLDLRHRDSLGRS